MMSMSVVNAYCHLPAVADPVREAARDASVGDARALARLMALTGHGSACLSYLADIRALLAADEGTPHTITPLSDARGVDLIGAADRHAAALRLTGALPGATPDDARRLFAEAGSAWF